MWITALPNAMPMDISVLCEYGHQGWWKFTMCKIIHKCSQLEPRNILKFQYVQLFEQRTSMFIICIIISPNEVFGDTSFGDIMVLASPPPRPRQPVDPDDVNALTRNIFNECLSKFI